MLNVPSIHPLARREPPPKQRKMRVVSWTGVKKALVIFAVN
jgi:hypothetical protein